MIVLLHGASGNAATWAPVRAAFGDTPVRALDLPGRGDSPGPPRDTVTALAARVAEQLAEDPGEPVVLVGHSLGGAVGLQLALDHPDVLSGLVLVSSASRLRVAPAILEAVRGATRGQPFRLDAAFGPDTPAAVIEAYHRDAAGTPPEASLADWLACDGFDVRDRLAEVGTRALVVHGDADAFTPARYQAPLAEALGAARVEVPGVGHMLPWEAPDALVAAVTGFVTG